MNEHKAKSPASPVPSGWESRTQIQDLVLMVGTALGIYVCYRLALPVLPALVWALVLAVLFTRLQRWLELKLKRPGLSAAISVLVVGLIVALPVSFVGQQLIMAEGQSA